MYRARIPVSRRAFIVSGILALVVGAPLLVAFYFATHKPAREMRIVGYRPVYVPQFCIGRVLDSTTVIVDNTRNVMQVGRWRCEAAGVRSPDVPAFPVYAAR